MVYTERVVVVVVNHPNQLQLQKNSIHTCLVQILVLVANVGVVLLNLNLSLV